MNGVDEFDTSCGLPSVVRKDEYATCAFPRRRVDNAPALWFIVNTEPRREKTAMGFLIGRGFRPYYPTELRRVKRGRVFDWVAYSMFPSVILLPMAVNSDRFDRVKATPGVLGFMLGTGGSYATVDDVAVSALRWHEIRGMDTREIPTGLVPPPPNMKRNVFKPAPQQVRIQQGPFGGLYAKLIAVDPLGRISLLLELFGRETKIEVDAAEIEAA